ncbi:MAG TPA: hypothetical protein VEW72_12140, partial [Burkholderiales bacterium]|nr:hypothetical protein [Burkholderiales bacterium]
MEARKQNRTALLQKGKDLLLSTLDDPEIRRSIAHRYSTAQFDEILILCAALEQFRFECVAWVAAPAETRQGRLQIFDQALREASEAQTACQLVLQPKLLNNVAAAIALGTSLPD